MYDRCFYHPVTIDPVHDYCMFSFFSFKTPRNTSDNTTELTEIPHSTKYYNICQNTNQIIQDIQNNMSATDGIQLPHQAYTIR
jgi:hypothetical protein